MPPHSTPLPGDPARTNTGRPPSPSDGQGEPRARSSGQQGGRNGAIILLMGVAGSGKTTVGRQLAAELGWPYHEADDFHSAANKEKMARGVPLDDADRAPWLAAIRAEIDACLAAGRSAVFTCSALKEKYRRVLLDGAPGVSLVHLAGDPATLQTRMDQRAGHYMKAGMLQSQFAALEAPANAITLDIRQSPAALVAEIRRRCGV